jgi:hypothetical protein
MNTPKLQKLLEDYFNVSELRDRTKINSSAYRAANNALAKLSPEIDSELDKLTADCEIIKEHE